MAIKANIVVDQGSTFATSINITDTSDGVINLSGYSGAAQMRKHFTSSNAVPFVVNILPDDGEVRLSLNANTTTDIPAGRYVYDVELTDTNGVVSRIVEGIVTVTPNVTR
jgi:hypothetical protein